MAFKLETPEPIRRDRGGVARDSMYDDAIDFAEKNPGEWFLFQSSELAADASKKTRSNEAARLSGRLRLLRAHAEKRDVKLETTTRKTDSEIKAYARKVTE